MRRGRVDCDCGRYGYGWFGERAAGAAGAARVEGECERTRTERRSAGLEDPAAGSRMMGLSVCQVARIWEARYVDSRSLEVLSERPKD